MEQTRSKRVHNTPREFDTLEEAISSTRQAAVRLLARREYATSELIAKLGQKGFPSEAIEAVIKYLQEKDLQSDERFAEAFIRSRISRGQGPVRLRVELQQLSIDEALVNRHLDSDESVWVELAQQVCRKRFGASRKMSSAERLRQQRFLQYRGFSFEQIKSALAQMGV